MDNISPPSVSAANANMIHSPALLTVSNLTVEYAQANQEASIALHNINLNLFEGERLTVVGQSGCGKSTLLNAIAGFLKPNAGAIKVRDKMITAPGPDRMVIFQEHGLLPWKTATENVIFALVHGKKMKPELAAEKARESLALVGLGNLGNKFPHQLSGGQKQRIAIARAFAMEAEILLMDEPFSALDQITKNLLQDELLALCEKIKTTVFFITHDILEAIKIGHKIIVLSANPGQVLAQLNSRYGQGAQAIEDQKNQIQKLLGVHEH